MLRRLGLRYSPEIFEKEDDQQAARIIIVLIAGAIVSCFITMLGGLYWKDSSVILIGLSGMLVQGVPLELFAHKHQSASSFIVGLSVLVIVTIGASLGQGIHDISIMAYPVIILIASLIMQRAGYITLTLLSLLSIGWLAYGEAHGLFIPLPTTRPSLADFLIMATILMMAVLIVNLQARDMRSNLHKAQQEIIQRKSMEEQLRYMSTHDILTGVYNRMFFDAEFTRMEKSRQYPISVIVADLDNLKKANDTLGHRAGDELLKRASKALRLTLRAGDILARIGGDEFAALLPATDEAAVQVILSRIQSRINEINSAQPDLHLQLSFGAASVEKGDLSGAFLEADRRMYAEKSAHKAVSAASPVLEHT